MAAMSENLGKREDAERYIKLAMQHEDRMTERERSRTRGLYYAKMGDWQKCIDEYAQLVSRYPADRVGHVNLAICYAQSRNIPKAIEESKRAVELVPKGAQPRLNLAFYSSLGGDFQAGEREARAALELSPSAPGYLFVAEAQLGQGQMSQAAETYHTLEKLNVSGASIASSGLADLAAYQGRFADAVPILEKGAAVDLAAKDAENAATKYVALGRIQLWRGERRPALEAAGKALALNQAVSVRFLAAQIYADAGELAKAQKLASSLASDLKTEPQVYGKIIEAKIALKRGDKRAGINTMLEANKLLDTWIGHLELGRAYLDAGLFVEADSEFDRCIRRRGEAMELFQDNVPTYAVFPPVYYYQGRVREGLKSPGFAESYRNYVAIRGPSGEDPLVAEVRRRLGQ
jgi:tetratricopeptide (TPR) repeat protein